MAICKLCKRTFFVITNTHLALHHLTIAKYKKRFGKHKTGFLLSVFQLDKNDPRYLKWRQSLKKRGPIWSKGHTKETHEGVRKISETFKRKKIDNFARWREQNRIVYPEFKQNKDLSFLVGMILGDGNIHLHDRTEGLRITLGTDKPLLWKYTAKVVERVFGKKPTVRKVYGSECVTITLYQKEISKRLGVPTGNRGKTKIKLLPWILNNKKFLIACIRGLYEAEGSFGVHKPTSTYKMIFSNKNDSLLRIVYTALVSLGFHPHKSLYKVQLSRKKEVYSFKRLINFRKYH